MDEFEVFDVKPFVSRLLGGHYAFIVEIVLYGPFQFITKYFWILNFVLLECQLGMGDWSGFMDKIHEVVPMDQQPELLQKLSEGNFTLRIMYEQFQNILKMGPIGQVRSWTVFIWFPLGSFELDQW